MNVLLFHFRFELHVVLLDLHLQVTWNMFSHCFSFIFACYHINCFKISVFCSEPIFLVKRHYTVCYCHVTYAFQSESTLFICMNIKELHAQNRLEIWSLSNSNGIRTHIHLFRRRIFNYLTWLAKWWSCFVTTYLNSAFHSVLLSCHVRVSEWIYTLYFPECQGTCCSIRYDIWSLSDNNGMRTQNHLVCEGTFNHLARLVKWLSCVVSTYRWSAFGCMLSSCHIRVSEWIYSLRFFEVQGNPCRKQVRYMNFKW